MRAGGSNADSNCRTTRTRSRSRRFADGVLIADWWNGRIYRISPSGDRLGDFSSPGMAAVLADAAYERAAYQQAGYAGTVLVLALFAGLLGWAVTRSRAEQARDAAVPTPSSTDPVVWLEPDDKAVRRIKRALAVFFGAVALLTAAVVAIMVQHDAFELKIVGMLVALASVFVVVAWFARVNASTSIGVAGDVVTLRDHAGRVETVAADQLMFEGTMVAGRRTAVFLGQPAMPLYDRQALMTHLYPCLASATSVSIWRMQALLIQMRHPQGVMAVVAIVGTMLAAAFLMVRNV